MITTCVSAVEAMQALLLDKSVPTATEVHSDRAGCRWLKSAQVIPHQKLPRHA